MILDTRSLTSFRVAGSGRSRRRSAPHCVRTVVVKCGPLLYDILPRRNAVRRKPAWIDAVSWRVKGASLIVDALSSLKDEGLSF